ncbi:Acetyl-coenzyme A synthetase [Corynebacterium occultum]|uniref:Acetyl-coenzyme A synthetase n=1 Tax=Corynebacterium occultum TaxID=2675219 RepID=A0A6B8VPR0_9CORY|nr:acetoacetate--CoA ligase [Corynebacterium occultum]QGU06073.1 Acetyl-coenzyme A synthetase [Corynebacterium occultum]
MTTVINPAPTTDNSSLITWQPTEEQLRDCRMARFAQWSAQRHQRELKDFRSLLDWSVAQPEEFWGSIRQFFDVLGDGFDTAPVLGEATMPFATWFPGAKLNFAENVLRHASDPLLRHTPAIIRVEENGERSDLSWVELEARVASLAATFRELGVQRGDRIAAILPNVPEAVIGLLAAASLGALWTINSPDLSAEASVRRIRQLEPKILVACDGYEFADKIIDRREHTAEVEAALPSLEATVLVRLLEPHRKAGEMAGEGHTTGVRIAFDEAVSQPALISYERVDFMAPLWILFSSGTTGDPKGIVHGHGGMVLDSLKGIALHQDIGPGDIYYVAANTSWMVWNTLVQNLLAGAAIVTYAGSPKVTGKDHHFQIISDMGVTMFATGAAYLSMVEKAGLDPAAGRDFSALRAILSTGSPLPSSTWRWVHEKVKQDVHLGSDSGGTDICGGFLGSNPMEPVHLGYLQGPLLGVAVEAHGPDGRPLLDEVGEMAVTRPLPSMPLFLWGDTDGERYRSSYFTAEPGVWMHGDWITRTSTGEFMVHGRADATLNRQGVRIGASDIYGVLQDIEEIEDCMVLGVEQADGGYWMPLFITPAAGAVLDDALRDRIRDTLRSRASARHVPDEIIECPGIPVTRTMKRLEVPIKRMFSETAGGQRIARDSVLNPEVLDWFQKLADTRRQSA